MSDLGNRDIEGLVLVVAGSLLKDTKIKPGDEIAIKAVVSLVTNLLQNINDLAYCAIEANERANR